MSNTVIQVIQTAMAISAYLLIFRNYLQPWFKAREFGEAILPLLILHIFRYLGLCLLVTGQIDLAVPRDALQWMAFGDLAAGGSALLAAIAVSARSKFATPLVVLFTIVGIGDLIMIAPTAKNAGVIDADIGTMWFFLVIFAPALLLSHLYIAYRLLIHRGQMPISNSSVASR